MKKIIQTLDIQQRCEGVFDGSRLIKEPTREFFKDFSVAWTHSPLLEDEEYKYLFVASRGASLVEFSTNPEKYQGCQEKINAQRRAALAAKIDIEGSCLFDVVPEHQLLGWLSERQSAMRNLQKLSIDKDKSYEILHKAHVLASNIARQDITFKGKKERVIYNIFGSSTGRFTTEKRSVPILTLKKEQRRLLEPQNDAFVEIDLNAAEIRMLLALCDQEQPKKDIHEWVSENIFSREYSREETKTKVFSWLYNISAPKSRLDKIFSRQIFRDFYCSEKKTLTTPFGRVLQVEERKAQNYLLQSTTSDQVVENAYKIQKMLKDRKTTVAFTLHDSIVLDMSKEDAIMLRDIKDQFEQTRWGKFISTCKIGKNFGNLKEMKI